MPFYRMYSAVEVSDHAAENSCWIGVNGFIYDLSPWVASLRDRVQAQKYIKSFGGQSEVAFYSLPYQLQQARILSRFQIGLLRSSHHAEEFLKGLRVADPPPDNPAFFQGIQQQQQQSPSDGDDEASEKRNRTLLPAATLGHREHVPFGTPSFTDRSEVINENAIQLPGDTELPELLDLRARVANLERQLAEKTEECNTKDIQIEELIATSEQLQVPTLWGAVCDIESTSYEKAITCIPFFVTPHQQELLSLVEVVERQQLMPLDIDNAVVEAHEPEQNQEQTKPGENDGLPFQIRTVSPRFARNSDENQSGAVFVLEPKNPKLHAALG